MSLLQFEMYGITGLTVHLTFNPSERVIGDEQLVAFRGRDPFWQYMALKPAEYGIKFWVLLEVIFEVSYHTLVKK